MSVKIMSKMKRRDLVSGGDLVIQREKSGKSAVLVKV